MMRPELAPRERIDAGGRLVEEQDLGLVHDGAGQRQALLEAAAAARRRCLHERLEVEAPIIRAIALAQALAASGRRRRRRTPGSGATLRSP